MSQKLALGRGEPCFAEGPVNANKATLSARWEMSANGEAVLATTEK